MTAIEETREAGKDTQADSQSVLGGVHPVLPYPHLPYGDAVHAELAAAGLKPDTLDTGVRSEEPGGARELILIASWSPGHPDLDDTLWPHGLTLCWSHLTGWSTHDGDTVRALDDVDELAPPALIADAVLHLAVLGPDTEWVPPIGGRWEHAPALDAALTQFEDREARR